MEKLEVILEKLHFVFPGQSQTNAVNKIIKTKKRRDTSKRFTFYNLESYESLTDRATTDRSNNNHRTHYAGSLTFDKLCLFTDNYNRGQTELIGRKFVYSETDYHYFSFLKHQTKVGFLDKKTVCPVPTYITPHDWTLKSTELSANFIRLTVPDAKRGVMSSNEHIERRLQGVVGKIIKQKLSSFFSSKPFSAPVKMFVPCSATGKICLAFCYLPTLIDRSGGYLLNFAAALIGSFHVSFDFLKPFEPLIGETFQGFIGEMQVFSECVQQKPCVLRIYGKHKDYTVSAKFEVNEEIKSLGGRMLLSTKGRIKLNIDGVELDAYMPKVQISNPTDKERAFCLKGNMLVRDFTNKTQVLVSFGNDPKYINGFIGKQTKLSILTTNEKEVYKIIEKYDVNKDKTIPEKEITGSWNDSFLVNKKAIWTVEDAPSNLEASYSAIPSDYRYREDITWAYRYNQCYNHESEELFEKYAQIMKDVLSERQRYERTLRK